MTVTPEVVCLGCVPLVDNERTNAYVQWARQQGMMPNGCCTFTDFNYCELDSPELPYTNPADDNACWYDPDIPESADFLGLWVVGLTGMEDDPFSRGVSDVSGDGLTFERQMNGGKTLTFDVMLLATSCCGMDYGYNWLVNVLKGQGCAHGASRLLDQCGTTELKIRVCCPDEGDADDGLRYFPAAALTNGVSRIDSDRRDHCCCNYRRYTFVIQTTGRNSYGPLIEVCSQSPDNDPENAQCRDWNGCEFVEEAEPCVDPTGCGDLFVEAFESPSLRDDCYCAPWSQTRTCCCIDQFQTGATTRAIVVDIKAGADPLNPVHTRLGTRNIEILFFENPQRLPCPTTQEEYDALKASRPLCARVTVGYIPSGATLRIDGRTGEAYIVCVGSKIPVYDGVEGDLKKLKTGCNPLIACAIWDASNVVLSPAGPGAIPSSITTYVAREFG